VGASVWDYMMTLMKEVLCGGMAVMSSCQLFCCIGSTRLQTTVTEKVSRMTGLSDALCTPDGLSIMRLDWLSVMCTLGGLAFSSHRIF